MTASWRDRAACAGVGTEAFFPTNGLKTETAAALCGRCPVVTDCFDYAKAEHMPYGTWGATSEQGRPEAFLNADRKHRRIRRLRLERRDAALAEARRLRRRDGERRRRAERAAAEGRPWQPRGARTGTGQ